jgi:hypothetical protein
MSKMCNIEYRYDYYLKEHEKTCKVLPSILCDICGEILGNKRSERAQERKAQGEDSP